MRPSPTSRPVTLVELALFDEASGGDDGVDARDLAGRFQVPCARREIEQGGDAAEGVEAEQQNGEALHVRHEHAHMLPRIRHGGELAPEDQRTQHQPPIGDGLTFGIFQRRLVAPEIIAGVHESFEQALARTRRVEFGQGSVPF